MKIPPNLRTADRCDKCKYCDTTRSKNVMDICTKHDNYAVFWNSICDDYEPEKKEINTTPHICSECGMAHTSSVCPENTWIVKAKK